ncbi:YkgJ family cysteine cluster protein [Methylocaldum szegediense]|uniref:YkgJ family cysteine cluster protein n=1 Tax=Methylocaldum szegediense TaxID=73780 RepID=UPI000428E93C|nr:YkgJ family cysteine cluster protein [Methylocaldum szegediense]
MTEFLRRPTHRYHDPLALVWIACAERVGFRIERTPHAYASTDGRGTIYIGTDDLLDPDDSLVQMILHELCHALVEGEEGERQVDWGLGHGFGKDPWREHACLRLQAYLADGVGLRDFFAPTTDFRVTFWNSLPADPFAAPPENGGRRERSCVAARVAAWRASQSRWAPHLQEALAVSAAIAALVPRVKHARDSGPATGADNGRIGHDLMPSLWETVAEPPARHPAGHAPVATYHQGRGCVDCAWSFIQRRRLRCRHAPNIPLPDDAPACARFEPAEELDCQSCGACCREAYDAVELTGCERVIERHPDLVVLNGTRAKLRRDGSRCIALSGGRTPSEAYACTIYKDRPKTCREFTRGSANCLDARRRVGLSL